ncbi:flagellar hook-associated protein FlgL [Halomonas mongoliensis]|uniref:flagellar hook-associated protein FlgL n=1 Tax=Halomonas mongoliensis TaxID=321265 RepID=UPI00403AACE6
MRISTVTMFEQSLNSLNRQQGEFLKVGQQIASGRRVVNPSDDPLAASRAVSVGQSISSVEQFSTARVSVRNSLSQGESVLNSVSDSLTRAKTLLVQASSDTLSPVDRQSVAAELRGLREGLLGQANTTDGNGRYLFGGFKDSAPPFIKEEEGEKITYEGDSNVRVQRVDGFREMPVSDPGDAIFGDIFDTLQTAIEALEAEAQQVDHDSLRQAMRDLDASFDKVLTVRASMGARLNELDAIDTVAGNRMLSYEQTRSQLVDLDYAEAITEYSLRQVGLQAAQRAYVDVQGLSLFDYLR